MVIITIYIRSPGDNIPLAAIREDRINDRCLGYEDGLGNTKLFNLGEFMHAYLRDHPGTQLIIRSE